MGMGLGFGTHRYILLEDKYKDGKEYKYNIININRNAN